MTMIAWILLCWLSASVAVAFFALCLIRGGGQRDDEAALEALTVDDVAPTVVA